MNEPFLVFSVFIPNFFEFSNGGNLKRIPSAQITNFGHFSSNFDKKVALFTKIA